MPGDRQRVRALLDETDAALQAARGAFDEEFPPTPSPQPPGPVIRVKVGDDVQAALDQARHEGATLLLTVGTHRCNLVVDADPEAQRVLITSDTTNLPGVGVRITRDYAPGLACLQSANGVDPVLRYACGSTGVNLRGLATLPQQYDRTVITFGTDGMTTVEEQPYSIVHDQLLMLGDPARGQHRGIQAGARGYTLRNSSLLDFHEEGRDSQALAAWNGGQYIWLSNCTFEAGAENIMVGGGSARVEALAPQQWLIEDCLFTKNPAWISGMTYPPSIKCLFEIKQLRHAVIRRCTFERCWRAAWDGLAIAIKCTDQSHNEPWTRTVDIDFTDNVIREVGQGLSIVGANDDGYGTQLMRDVRIRRTSLLGMNVAPYVGRGTAFMISNMPENLVIDRTTITGNSYAIAEITFNQAEQGTGFTLTNTAIWQGNYGIKSPSGMDCWDWQADLGYAPEVRNNAFRTDPDRTPDFGPGNTHVAEADFDASIAADGSILPGSAIDTVPSTDGDGPIGCPPSALTRRR